MRVGSLLAWLVVAGCYAPTLSSGAPCDPATDNCPQGQSCVAQAGGYFCSTTGTGPTDGSIVDQQPAGDGHPGDMDGDGIADAVDNCPTKSNANQANEDGDLLGDECDPCPPFADNTDSDHDGVGDLCDPHPSTVGDKIALFEGFASGIPQTWVNNSGWTASNGDAVIASADGTVAYLEPPLVPANGTVSMGFTPQVMFGTGGHGFGVTNPSASAGTSGLVCELLTGAAGETQGGIVNMATGVPSATMNMTWALGDEMVVGFQRSDNMFGCLVIDGASTATTSTMMTLSLSVMAIRSRSVSGRAHWLMVTTP
jgi:hypothetical protein